MDATNGKQLWDTTKVGEKAKAKAYTMTLAPLAIKDKVMVGVAKARIRDPRLHRLLMMPKTGKEGLEGLCYTLSPARASPDTTRGRPTCLGTRRRLTVWTTGSYNPEAEPGLIGGSATRDPTSMPTTREGDNLYSDSVVALDADTGKLKWHFQFTPHDLWDYDSTMEHDPVRAGRARSCSVTSTRTGYFFVLDRTERRAGQRVTPFVDRIDWGVIDPRRAR